MACAVDSRISVSSVRGVMGSAPVARLLLRGARAAAQARAKAEARARA